MEGQNRTAANTGKLCCNSSINFMVDYSLENKATGIFFVVLFFLVSDN